MTPLILSAHELTKTRLCQARDCTHDAEPLSMLCNHCDTRWRAGKELHINAVIQPPPPDPTLELCCNRCLQHKPDHEFSRNSENKHRRGRRTECKACCTGRRQAYRQALSAEKRAEQLARDRERQRRRNAARAKKSAS